MGVLSLMALTVFGQDNRAKIQGIVTDSSDASMAGAKVTIRNVNTGITATRETGANGAYLFDNVEPGTYAASAESQGFSRQQQEGVLRSEEHTSELQSRGQLVCRLLLEKKKTQMMAIPTRA